MMKVRKMNRHRAALSGTKTWGSMRKRGKLIWWCVSPKYRGGGHWS